MKKAVFPFFISVLVLVALACSLNPATVFATPTPLPTQTPLPTFTPLPSPTSPSRPGVDFPVRYSGTSFTVMEISLVTSWSFDGDTKIPTRTGDLFLAVYRKFEGDLNFVVLPQTEDSEKTFHIEDNNGRVDQWARFEPSPTVLVAIFVGDGSTSNYIFTFPDGQEIDLQSFLY